PGPRPRPLRRPGRHRRLPGRQRRVRPVDHRLLRALRGSERARLPAVREGGQVGAAGSTRRRLTIEGVRSLETRWIFPGRLEAAMAGWFGRFPAAVEQQEDAYLLDPHLHGLSVKIRGGRAFEVKIYQGSLGTLDAAGRARGRMERWEKWSFPFAPLT